MSINERLNALRRFAARLDIRPSKLANCFSHYVDEFHAQRTNHAYTWDQIVDYAVNRYKDERQRQTETPTVVDRPGCTLHELRQIEVLFSAGFQNGALDLIRKLLTKAEQQCNTK